MCGINGIISNKFNNEATILRMNDSISYRGPDDHGTYIHDQLALGHRRLSIVDLSKNGHQPMMDAAGDTVLIFNGEIYNHQELRQSLDHGQFKGNSDSETILYGYKKWGTKIFGMLNGIFALALFDKTSNKLMVARDRFGVKPLYYSVVENNFFFSSEIKAILSGNNEFRKKLNHQALQEFIYFGYAMNGKTLYKDIHKVGPGQYLEIAIDDSRSLKIHTYYDLKNASPKNLITDEKDAISTTRELLQAAVHRQLMSDVPVGVFLSGGVDSTAITAIASEAYKGKLKTYTASFDFYQGHDELTLARKTATLFNTDHHEMHIKGGDIGELVETLVHHHDEPFSDAANIPLYLLTKHVKDQCKVILQGDGGDELFGGYNGYQILSKYKKYKTFTTLLHFGKMLIFSDDLKAKTERFYDILHEKDTGIAIALLSTMETRLNNPTNVFSKNYRSHLNGNPFEYYQTLANETNYLDKTDTLFYANMKTMLPEQFLEKVDKSTMANSVEVRVPFLDNELADFAMRLPATTKLKNGEKKYILKQALKGIVPDEVLNGPKKGFGVPYGNWLKGPLYKLFMKKVHSTYIKDLDVFDLDYIDNLMKAHMSGKANNSFILWKVFNLSIWLEAYNIEI